MKTALIVALVSIIALASILGYLATQLQDKGAELAACEQALSTSEQAAAGYREQVAELTPAYETWKGDVQYWKMKAALSGISGYQMWESPEVLTEWLALDQTDTHEYIRDDYDCDDYAIDLVLSALSDGYWIGLGLREGHMFNFAIVGNVIYKVEATTDAVTLWGYVD